MYCTAYLLYQFSLDHRVTLNSTDSNEVRRMFANFSVMDQQCKRANSNLRALLQNMARLPTLEIVLASLSGSLDMLHVRLKSIVIRGCWGSCFLSRGWEHGCRSYRGKVAFDSSSSMCFSLSYSRNTLEGLLLVTQPACYHSIISLAQSASYTVSDTIVRSTDCYSVIPALEGLWELRRQSIWLDCLTG